MTTRMTLLATLGIGILATAAAFGRPAVDETPPVHRIAPPIDAGLASGPRIQIALLLDTSNSMDGLIHQAKTRLWSIVNEFALARRDGRAPLVEVALFEYGNDGLAKEDGFIRRVAELTTDLDRISEELFALTTNGGSEYCGHVIRDAVESLDWSPDSNDLKVIVIAGNEAFTQGSVDFRRSCGDAIARGILVNTIFCGPHDTGIATGWKEGATLADGSYLSIDANATLVHIPAPQDAEILRLSADVNETYMAYGRAGAAGQARQQAQDENAVGASESGAIERAVTKSTQNYRNDVWDLVDAVRLGRVLLKDVATDDLPDDMRKMTIAQREAHVQSMTARRAGLQKRIQELNAARAKFVAAEIAKQGGSPEKTLEAAMSRSLRKQAREKRFDFDAPGPGK